MSPSDVHGAKVLILENQESNLELLEHTLDKDGFTRIHKPKKSSNTIDLLRNNNYDLIILDFDFLGKAAFKLMKNLQNNLLEPYSCVIAISEDSKLALRALKSGARDFICRPYDLEELLLRIYNVLEVRLLFKALEKNVQELKVQFDEGTKALQESEARFRAFTDLASDWYWEQDSLGGFTKVSGPVPEILGIEVDSSTETTNSLLGTGWNAQEQSILRNKITAREPFLDFEFTRTTPDGRRQTFLVSGQPMFDRSCNFLGYRGVGVEINAMYEH